MKTVLSIADRYVKTSDWKTIAILKFCLLALGLIIGMQISEEHKKPVTRCALAVFLATYIPLMGKFIKLCIEWREEQ